MAEQVQAILERMVPYLKDLRNRHIFTSGEIQLIVERRRRSEYLLQRRSQAQISDYLRYIEDEIQLERLRKLRKEKVLTEMKNEEKEKKRKMWKMSRINCNDDDDDTTKEETNDTASYQTSGPGDSHILSHIHFLYQRTLRKFHYPIDVLLNYAEFSKEVKSFHMLSRVYAMGLQHHPREAGLWIEAASFEYFGYVAQDYENNKNGKDGDEEEKGGAGLVGTVNSKIVGSSIKNARVLMQRGLRINKTSTELWLQYFALELHYVQKLRGRREILLLKNLDKVGEEEEEEEINIARGDNEEGVPTSLLPCQVIFKNAILAIPNNVQFRLRFVEACQMFPDTSSLEAIIMTSIEQNFGMSVEGWVARISYAEEQMKNRMKRKDTTTNVNGFLVRKFDDDDDDDGGNDDEIDDGENSSDRPMKKARINNQLHESNSDVALDLLQKALEAVPSPKLYSEAVRFLRMRIQCLLEDKRAKLNKEESGDDDDVSYLMEEGEDANGAAKRLMSLLEGLYESAKTKNISSTTLTLDHVDFLLSIDQPMKAEQLLSNAITSMTDVDVHLWLRWAEISKRLSPSPTSSICILRRALKRTPLHDRHAHTLILTELMQQLMTQPSSQKTKVELQSLFQKLILLSQGLSYAPSSSSKDDDNENDESWGAVNVASTVLAYLNYTILNNNNSGDDNSVRSIYTSLIYHSNYGKSCHGKTQDELLDIKSFFDACIRYERDCCSPSLSSANTTKKDGKKEKMAQKIRLNKLYTAAISFYSSGGSSIMWRNVVNNFQRDLDDLNCGR